MSNKLDILFVNPPYSNYYAPLLGTPCLMGFLKRHNEESGVNIRAEQIDLSILHFKKMIIKQGTQSLAYLRQREYVENLSQEQMLQIQYRDFAAYLEDSSFLIQQTLSVEYIRSIISQLNRVQLNILDLWMNLVINKNSITTIQDIDYDPDNIGNVTDASDLLMTLFSCQWFTSNTQMPRIIGISVSFEAQMPAALIYAKIFKQMSADTKIVIGGSYIDIMAAGHNEKFIENTLKVADFLSVHEGETCIEKLIQYIKRADMNLNDVPNLVYRGFDGTIIKTKAFMENVDNLPMPDFTGLNIDDYIMPGGMLPYQTSRGCFYGRCAFCSHEEEYRGNHRVKSAEKSIEELVQLKNIWGNKHIIFVDEAIEYNSFVDLVSLMDTKDSLDGLEWMYYSRVDARYNQEIVDKAYKNGCRMVFFGVETFSQRLLDFIKKGARAAVAQSNIKLFSGVGIKTFIWMMYGLPSQNPDEVMYDIKKIKENCEYIHSVALCLFGLYPATDMMKNPAAFNIQTYSEDPFDFTSHYNGEIIDRNEIYKITGKYYYPFLFSTFASSNRFLAYIDNTTERKVMEPIIDKDPILNELFGISEKRDDDTSSLNIGLQYSKLQNYVLQLSEGKAWLEEQYYNYKAESERKDCVIEELQGWVHQLEDAKVWLNQQYENYKAESERKDRIIEKLKE
jgi:anaerobic magnesium-protoporphyrin IX monomethyl ester cyclase